MWIRATETVREVSKLLRAECLLREALDEDEDLNHKSALELYCQAIDLCIEAVSDLMVNFRLCFGIGPSLKTIFYSRSKPNITCQIRNMLGLSPRN